MAILLIERKGQEDEKFALPDKEVRIGRSSENEVVINEPSISRHHALISPSKDGHTVQDLGSRNGIWVNGQRAGDTPVPLRHGDEVELGGEGVVVQYMAEEESAPDVTAFFAKVPQIEKQLGPDILYERGGRWVKLLRMTPWLRFVGAAIGTLAAILALAFWIIRWLAG